LKLHIYKSYKRLNTKLKNYLLDDIVCYIKLREKKINLVCVCVRARVCVRDFFRRIRTISIHLPNVLERLHSF